MKGGEALLRVPHALLWRPVSLSRICHECGSLWVERVVACHHVDVGSLQGLVLVFDHDLPDGSLLGEVELVDSLLEQLRVDLAEADHELGACRLQSWLLLGVSVHRVCDVPEALYVEVLLVAEHDRELLEQHLQNAEQPHKDFHLLSQFLLVLLLAHARGRWHLHGGADSLDVLQHFLCHDEGPDVAVLGEVDDDLVAGDSDAHIDAARIGDDQTDELTNH